MLRPQRGNDRNAVYEASDGWDSYTERPGGAAALPVEPNPFAGMEATTEETLVKAFAASNASRALGEEMAPFDEGRKLLRMQHKEKTYEQYNPNILPTPAVRPSCVVDEFYLGGLGVKERSKSGKTFVDRLGNEFDIWESEMPPPDKDYSTIAPNTSQRHLERCQGADPYFYDRPKKEVSDKVNPPEPRGDGRVRRERQNAAELKGRQTFFNQAGMQGVPEMDAQRDTMYDGYNIKTDYSKRTYPVENCWRATQIGSNEPGGEPVGPGVKVRSNVHLKRREGGAPFSQPEARGAHASARNARISLPIMKAATLRATKLDDQARGTAKFAATSNAVAPKQQGDHSQGHRKDAGDLEPSRPAADGAARGVDPAVQVHGDTEKAYQAEQLGLKAPVEFVSAPADLEARALHRENGLLKPAPSRDVEVAKRIIQGMEHDMDDDVELSEIHQRATEEMPLAPLREDGDHPERPEMERPENQRDFVPVEASVARAEVRVGADDTGIDAARTEGALVRAARAHADVTRHGHDEVRVDHERSEGALVRAGKAPIDVTRHGRDEVEYTHEALQFVGETKPVHGDVRVDDMREMCDDGPVERDAAVHSRRVDALARADGADARRVNVARVDMRYGAVDPARAAPTINVSPRAQLADPEQRNKNAQGRLRVEAWPTIDEERVNVAKRTQQAVARIGSAPYRADFDSLPLEDRACVAVRGRVDGTESHRMLDGGTDGIETIRSRQYTERIGGGKSASTNAPRPAAKIDSFPQPEPGAYARTNSGHGEAQRNPVLMHRTPHREDTSRASYGTMQPRSHGGKTELMGMRVAPSETNALAGTTKNERLDLPGGVSVAGPLLRATVQSVHDRSTPVPRSLTPAINMSNARWTPTLQVESRREQPQRCS